jgi:hypothetical protein
MSDQVQGVLEIEDTAGTTTHIALSGDNGEIDVGGSGANGSVILQDAQGKPHIRLGRALAGKPPNVFTVWEISVLDDSGKKIAVLGPSGDLRLGEKGTGGDLTVLGQNGKIRFRVLGDSGFVELRDVQDQTRVELDAKEGITVNQSGTDRAGYFHSTAAKSTNPALEGRQDGSGDGVVGASSGVYKSGVYGTTDELTGYGVFGRNERFACFGTLGARPLLEDDPIPCGVLGETSQINEEGGSYGVMGRGNGSLCVGVGAVSDQYVGLSARCLDSVNNPDADWLHAGLFQGNVAVAGELWAYAKNCKADHPLDPANKFLVHACVESSERLNIYRGSAVLNSRGEATVRLPKWAEAFNGEFEYQLTPIGGSAPDLHIAEPINDGRFRIAGGRAGQRVSWQVSGVRADAYARAHPLRVEVPKRAADRGTYLNPIEHGKSDRERFKFRPRTVPSVRRREAVKARRK